MKTKIFLMIAGMMLVLFSCQKDTDEIDQTTLDDAELEAVAYVVFEDVFSLVDNAEMLIDANGADVAADCPIVTITQPQEWPKTVTLDFGTGCTGFNDNTRKGKIRMRESKHWYGSGSYGSTRTVTFENYYFNDIKVEGTEVFKMEGINSSAHFVVSVTLTAGKLTLPDGSIIERTVAHRREWIAGFNTPNIWDDECLVTGIATGKIRNDVTYTNTLIGPLHWKRACKFLTEGVIKMKRSTDPVPVNLDFGDGECDANAVVTRGDQSKDILLRHRLN